MRILVWHTDPYLYREEIDQILLILRNPQYYKVLSEEIADFGIFTRYRFDLEDTEDMEVESLINSIRYYPLTLNIPYPKLLSLAEQTYYFKGIIDYLKTYIEKITKIKVSRVEKLDYEDYVQLTPEMDGGNLFYYDSRQLASVQSSCEIEKVFGFKPITSSPIFPYLSMIENLNLGFKEVNSIYLTTFDKNYDAGNLTLQIEAAEVEFFYLEYNPLYEEIARLWETDILLSNEKYLILKTRIELSDPAEWFKNTALLIETDQLPYFTVSGSWVVHPIDRKLVKYGAVMTYVKLCQSERPLLIGEIDSLIVHPDYTITARFVRYEDVIFFRENLQLLLADSCKWTSIPIPSPLDGMLLRFKLKEAYHHLYPVTIRDGDEIDVVINSGDITLPQFTETDYKKMLDTLKERYQGCSVDKVSDLMNLVSYGNNCIDLDTLQDADELSLDQERLIQYQQLAVDGILRMTIFPGLLQDPPLEEPIAPADGGLALIKYDSFGKKMIDAEIVTRDRRRYLLFRVNEFEVDKIFQLTNCLWGIGWFLSPWARVYGEETKSLSSHPIRKIPELRTSDSKKVLSFLERNQI